MRRALCLLDALVLYCTTSMHSRKPFNDLSRPAGVYERSSPTMHSNIFVTTRW